MDLVLAIILIAVALVGGGVAGFVLGGAHRKKVAEAAIGSATQEATRIVNNAMTEAEQKKKEAILEAKDEIHKLRSETEHDLRERRAEVQRQERRIVQKEESLDKKIEAHEKKEEALAKRIKELEAKELEVESLKRSQLEILERISGYSKELICLFFCHLLPFSFEYKTLASSFEGFSSGFSPGLLSPPLGPLQAVNNPIVSNAAHKTFSFFIINSFFLCITIYIYRR